MKIIFIGDIVGENGVNLLRKGLWKIKQEYNADICIANAENANHSGTGLTNNDAQDIFACGVDVLTGGNHSLRRSDVSLYEDNDFILCPANLLSANIDDGVCTIDLGAKQISIISLVGNAFMDNHNNAFSTIDKLLKKDLSKNILVDFHAESTAEKYAFANYLDGKVSAVVGTHTHVQTNDAHILPNGTAFVTDVGCVCAHNSVLGVMTHQAIQKQRFLTPTKFTVQNGSGYINGCFIELNIDGSANNIINFSYFIQN